QSGLVDVAPCQGGAGAHRSTAVHWGMGGLPRRKSGCGARRLWSDNPPASFVRAQPGPSVGAHDRGRSAEANGATPGRLIDFRPMAAREERLARNEAFFRELNERLEELTPESSSELVVLCECANQDCAQRLTLRKEEYEEIRAHDTFFVVAHGHADLGI